MAGMVSDRDMARVYLSLEGPQLVRDLLEGRGDDIDLDLLATILAECAPEKCLLVLACAANHVYDYGAVDTALKVSLKMLAGDVLDDYAPLYLARLKAKEASHYEAQIVYMQEDLEAFGELFALASDLSPTNSLQYQVCAILSDQALAQAEMLGETEPDMDYSRDTVTEPVATPLVLCTGNIIPFPGLFRRT